MMLRNTEINREGVSPSGEIRTEITFTDSWGDQLEVVFNPKLRRVYMNSDVASVSLSEDQMQILLVESAKFFLEGK